MSTVPVYMSKPLDTCAKETRNTGVYMGKHRLLNLGQFVNVLCELSERCPLAASLTILYCIPGTEAPGDSS
jgi:hypothetical protein